MTDDVTRPSVGDRIQFDGKRTGWLVRAEARNGRYQIATGSLFGAIYYTIIDHDEQVRGPLNTVFGLPEAITTTTGPDAGIDALAEMLDGTWLLAEGEEPCETWEVSYRHRLPLHLARIKRAAAEQEAQHG